MGANDNKAHAEELFTIQDANWEFNFIVHPSGDYVYMMVQNQHYILRSNYDRVNKRLTTPYIVCGQPGQADYKDLAGTKARLNKPGQESSYLTKSMRMRIKRIVMTSILRIVIITVYVN